MVEFKMAATFLVLNSKEGIEKQEFAMQCFDHFFNEDLKKPDTFSLILRVDFNLYSKHKKKL